VWAAGHSEPVPHRSPSQPPESRQEQKAPSKGCHTFTGCAACQPQERVREKERKKRERERGRERKRERERERKRERRERAE